MPSGVYVHRKRPEFKRKKGGIQSRLGVKLSAETKNKIKEANIASMKARKEAGRYIPPPRTGSSRVCADSLEWKKKVMEKYNSTCQHCGATQEEYFKKTGDSLEGHHIKSWEKFPELRYDIDNGLLLCSPCHMKEERRLKKVRQSELQRT